MFDKYKIMSVKKDSFDKADVVVSKVLKGLPNITRYNNRGVAVLVDPRSIFLSISIEVVRQLYYLESSPILSCCFTREIGLAERVRAGEYLLSRFNLLGAKVKALNSAYARALRTATYLRSVSAVGIRGVHDQKHQNEKMVSAIVTTLSDYLEHTKDLSSGEFCCLPGGWSRRGNNHANYFLIRKNDDESYDLSVCDNIYIDKASGQQYYLAITNIPKAEFIRLSMDLFQNVLLGVVGINGDSEVSGALKMFMQGSKTAGATASLHERQNPITDNCVLANLDLFDSLALGDDYNAYIDRVKQFAVNRMLEMDSHGFDGHKFLKSWLIKNNIPFG